MESVYDPKKIVNNELASQEDYLIHREKLEFNVGQCYEGLPAKTLVCKHCGGDTFKVAQGSYFTAVKCVRCEYEICIHDG